MKTHADGKIALKILLNYFRDGVDVVWDDSNKINKLVKKYISGGFDTGFIETAIIEGKKILDSVNFPEKWVKEEAGNFILNKFDMTCRKFFKLLLKTLQTEFKLFQERKNNYYFKEIFVVSKETQEFYDSKYKKLSCLTKYFKYYSDDIDNIKKLVFEEKYSEVIKTKDELENILQENPFPYQWLANSLQRKVIQIKGINEASKYYNWTAETLKQLQKTIKHIPITTGNVKIFS